MRWYELAKIVHFMGLAALFGYFMISLRFGMQLRAATRSSDARTWLLLLTRSRGMLHGGSALMLVSGIAMIALRWRGRFPFTAIGMISLLAIWALSAVSARHLRAIRAALPSGEGSIAGSVRALILAPTPWIVTAAMNGAAAGVLVVMTWKPEWLGAIATILLASAAGAMIGRASLRRRQHAGASVGDLSTVS